MKKDKNTGRKFEKLTGSIFRKLVLNHQYEKVEHDVQVSGDDGLRQIDILLTTKTFGVEIKTVIECKDHGRKISVGVVDAFESKLQDIRADKGILISKKGFSSQSFSKAKRKGITLCTAHEALNDNWDPEIDLPILIEEVKPNGMNLLMEFKVVTPKKLTVSKFPVINGINIVQLMENKWRKGTLDIEPKTSVQLIKLEELKSPYYWVPENENDKWPVKFFEIELNIVANYYLTSLGELRGTEILNNISDNIKSVFIDTTSIIELVKNVKPVRENIKNGFRGLLLPLNITPNFDPRPKSVTRIK